MEAKEKEVCANCKYWQDYEVRVWALIQGHTENRSRG